MLALIHCANRVPYLSQPLIMFALRAGAIHEAIVAEGVVDECKSLGCLFELGRVQVVLVPGLELERSHSLVAEPSV